MTQPGSQRDRNRLLFEQQSREDRERREYESLRDRMLQVQEAEPFITTARGVLRFLDTEPNPAYGDALVTLSMSTAHRVVLVLLDDVPTYARMMTKRVSTTALNIESVWRGILDDHASNASE